MRTPGGATFLISPYSALAQVVSPLTESVLGETLLTVTEEKVSIIQLQAQVVASLALSLRPSPGNSHTILATTAAQQTLSFLKQVSTGTALMGVHGTPESSHPLCFSTPRSPLANGRTVCPS